MSHFPIAEPPSSLGPTSVTPNPLEFRTGLVTSGIVFASVSGIIDCKSSAAQLLGYLPSYSLAVGPPGAFTAARFFPIQVMTTIQDGYGPGLNTPTLNVGFTGPNYTDWCATAAIGKITGGALSAMIATGQYAKTSIKSVNRYAVDLDLSTKLPIYAKMQAVSDATKDIRSVTILGFFAENA